MSDQKTELPTFGETLKQIREIGVHLISISDPDEWDDELVLQAELQASGDRLKVLVENIKNACSVYDDAIQQVLGKALGYPMFCDDPFNFPDAKESDGVSVGDHVGITLAEEAADRIRQLTRVALQARRAFAELNGEVIYKKWSELYEVNKALDDALGKAS